MISNIRGELSGVQVSMIKQYLHNLRELVTSTTVICNTRTRVEGRSELELDPPLPRNPGYPGNPGNPGNPDENSQMLILMHRHRGSVDLGRKRWSIFNHGSSESRLFNKNLPKSLKNTKQSKKNRKNESGLAHDTRVKTK